MNTKCFININIYHRHNICATCINNVFNQIMNIKCFINSNIYHHNNIYSKTKGASQYFS